MIGTDRSVPPTVSLDMFREFVRIEYHPNLYEEADWRGNYVMGLEEIIVARPEGEMPLKALVNFVESGY